MEARQDGTRNRKEEQIQKGKKGKEKAERVLAGGGGREGWKGQCHSRELTEHEIKPCQEPFIFWLGLPGLLVRWAGVGSGRTLLMIPPITARKWHPYSGRWQNKDRTTFEPCGRLVWLL